MVECKAVDAGALEERILRRNEVATSIAFERQSIFHFRHHFEVIAFHAVGAPNGIEIGHSEYSETRDSVGFPESKLIEPTWWSGMIGLKSNDDKESFGPTDPQQRIEAGNVLISWAAQTARRTGPISLVISTALRD